LSKKLKRRRSYVFVARLDETAADSKNTRELNPEADTDALCVFVGISWRKRPEERFLDGDFSSAGSKTLRRLAVELLPQPRSSHITKEGAHSAREKLVQRLRDEGWMVHNRPPKPEYQVYVIELSADVAELPGVTKRNPDWNPDLPCVYVGQSRYSPDERLQQHIDGERPAKNVKKQTIVGLRPDLSENLSFLTELESLREERHLAHRLRKLGYAVVGGH